MQKVAAEKTKTKYFEAVGRRKTAVARVRLEESKKAKNFLVNDKEIEKYFVYPKYTQIAESPLAQAGLKDKVSLSVKVRGGGINAQAEAIRHGVSRVLVVYNPELRPGLKALSFLKRDPRMVERKKYGLKKSRRAPQWAKR